VIALKALNMITGSKTAKATEEKPEGEEEIVLGPQTLETTTSSLLTLNPSRILKISNIYDRDKPLSVEQYLELKDDFEAEMQNIG